MHQNLSNVCHYLQGLPAGKIQDPSELERLLAPFWNAQRGHLAGGMAGDTLIGRLKNVRWKSPLLDFEIEMPGATAPGSVDAALQRWRVNVEEGWASCYPSDKPWIGKKQRPLKLRLLAQEIVSLILEGQEDPRLQWLAADRSRVQLEMGEILPADGPQVIWQGRRKRFHHTVEALLAPHGWARLPRGFLTIFERKIPLAPFVR
jgi:hypothetical protein